LSRTGCNMSRYCRNSDFIGRRFIWSNSKRSYKDLDRQRVIDHIAAEIWIVTLWLGRLVCSRRPRQQRITAGLCRRDPIVVPAAPGVPAHRVEEIALNPRCAAIEADPDLGDFGVPRTALKGAK
jgi:hypothetical protein